MAYTVTAAEVATWAKGSTPAGAELTLMNQLIAAVAERIERDYAVNTDEPTAGQLVALKMEVARLWQRRDTPEGVGVFGVDGVIRVTSEDLDVDRLLSRKWGFA